MGDLGVAPDFQRMPYGENEQLSWLTFLLMLNLGLARLRLDRNILAKR